MSKFQWAGSPNGEAKISLLVLNDDTTLPDFPFARVYRIAHAERDWRVLLNVLESARILASENPDIVLSAGAGPAVPMALVARLAWSLATGEEAPLVMYMGSALLFMALSGFLLLCGLLSELVSNTGDLELGRLAMLTARQHGGVTVDRSDEP